MNVIAVYPYTTTFDRWASDLSEQLSSYNAPNPGTEDLWQAWAARIIEIPEVAELGAPDPRAFEAWDDWASALLLILD